jgi:hypothetical protein
MAVIKLIVVTGFLLTGGAFAIGTMAVMYRGACPGCAGITVCAETTNAFVKTSSRQCLRCGRISCHKADAVLQKRFENGPAQQETSGPTNSKRYVLFNLGDNR